MSITKEQVIKMVYDAGLTTLGAVAVGFASKKLLKTELGVPMSGIGIVKMAGSIAGGTAIVSYMKQKKWIPDKIEN